MQLAAFLCVICAICGRITRKSTQSISTNETPMSPADFADLRRQTTITTKQPLPQTNCLSLRDNAACCIPLCVICVICGRIHARVLNLLAYMNPQYLPQILLIYADKTQKRKTTLTIPTCLSLRNNAACCIPLRDLRHLRENNMQAYSINLQTRNHNISRRSRR